MSSASQLTEQLAGQQLGSSALAGSEFKVLIVNMPFAAIRPAIGASLLVAHLKRIGVEAHIAYLNIQYFQQLGSADYTFISDSSPTQCLAGDWVFSEALFGDRPDADAAYLSSLRERFRQFSRGDSFLSILTKARSHVRLFLDECLSGIAWDEYSVVGFTSSFTQHAASLALARDIKAAYPHIKVVFGGANCEDMMGLSLHRSFPFVDFVCSGEADVSFPQLVKTLMESGDCHRIPGLISRSDKGSSFSSLVPERIQNLDDLPHPDFDDYMRQHEKAFPAAAKSRRRILMETSRGCWWGQKQHCTFCGLNGMAMTYRSKSPGRVLSEIEALSRRYSAEYIEFVDNILDMKYLSDVLPEIRRRQLNMEFFYETKANLRKHQLELLRDAGVLSIQPGIESLSTSVLKLMRKGTTAIQNIQLLKWCAELGISVCWNFLYGFPGENPDDYHEMLPLIAAVSHFEPPRGHGPIRLDRFSPNFVSAAEHGFANVRPDRSYGFIYDLSEQELFDLAYYFEHDYADGTDPLSYTAEVLKAIRGWCRYYRPRSLLYADHGNMIALCDLRPFADQRLTILDGAERALYLYCDERRTRNAIEEFLSDSNTGDFDLEGFLHRLLQARLMVYVDDQYLSLAIPVTSEERRNHSSAQVGPRKDLVFF